MWSKVSLDRFDTPRGVLDYLYNIDENDNVIVNHSMMSKMTIMAQ